MSVAERPVRITSLGMLLFVCSETMFFAALFSAYFAVRARAAEWPPERVEIETLLPLALTAVLLASSVTVFFAERTAERGDGGRARLLTIATALLGLAFLAGQAYEYSRLPFSVGDGSFETLFFTITGFHGLHVLVGVLILTVAVARLGRAADPVPLNAAALYWHFVDAVWLVVLATLYLANA